MTLREQLQEAADAGHRKKLEDDLAAEEARAAAEKIRLTAETEVVANLLAMLPKSMHDAARKGCTHFSAFTVAVREIDFAIAIEERGPVQRTSLTGVSRRLFDTLQELQLNPHVARVGPAEYSIEIPVLPASCDASV